MTVAAVLFDLDDTLLPEHAAAHAAILATAQTADAGVDPAALAVSLRAHARALWRASPTIDYARRVGISSWEGLWADLTGDSAGLTALRVWAPTYRTAAWSQALEHGLHPDQLAAHLAVQLHDERPARHHPYPDTIPPLDALAGRHPLAVVTNRAPALQRAKLAAADLAAYFTTVVVSADVGAAKPDPATFHEALRGLGVPAAAAVMVGDNLDRDVRGAQAAGLQAVWLHRQPTGEHPPEYEPHITGLTPLPEFLY